MEQTDMATLLQAGGQSCLWVEALPLVLEQDYFLTADSREALSLWQARTGEIVTVITPSLQYYRARIISLVTGKIRPFALLNDHLEPPAARILLQAVPDKERMLWIIQKAVELGATAIVPLLSDKANPLDACQDKSSTWSQVARKAAKQCRRAIIPPVLPPIAIDWSWRTGLLGQEFFLDMTEGAVTAPSFIQTTRQQEMIALWVGPEGGWSQNERNQFLARGCQALSLGARIVRTETAGLVALSLCMVIDAIV